MVKHIEDPLVELGVTPVVPEQPEKQPAASGADAAKLSFQTC